VCKPPQTYSLVADASGKSPVCGMTIGYQQHVLVDDGQQQWCSCALVNAS
jgi:hypothetical protein